jgi:hypothetical protein
VNRPCLCCGRLTPASRCPSCRTRRYGRGHQRLRQAWNARVATGSVRCGRCGQPIASGELWHLDHLPSGVRHPSHAACNVANTGR